MGSQPLIAVTRRREIRPEGTEEDALAFQNAAVQIRVVAETFRGHLVRLGLNWSGRAADRFMDGFRPLPNRLDSLAEGMDVQAGRINHKTVTIIETVLVHPRGTQPD